MDLVKQNLGIFASFTLIYVAFLVAVWRMGEIGSGFNVILSGPISAGYYLTIHRMANAKPFGFENFFDGFRIFLPVMTISLISGLLTSIGAMFYIFPAFIIALFLLFAMPLTIFAQADFMTALKSSFMIVRKQFLEIAKFGLFILLINLAAVFTFGIGFLFTLPMSFAAIYYAYDDIIGVQDNIEEEKPNLHHFR
ncbi:MAG: hypothetical protein KAH25_08885 [Bacteroidales bacterium]|nr:hypothetical protein [Bacteroidales bacterium]